MKFRRNNFQYIFFFKALYFEPSLNILIIFSVSGYFNAYNMLIFQFESLVIVVIQNLLNILYYLHMHLRSNRLGLQWNDFFCLWIWSPVLPGKQDLLVILFGVLIYCSDHNFPGNYNPWSQNFFGVLISRGLNFPLHRSQKNWKLLPVCIFLFSY